MQQLESSPNPDAASKLFSGAIPAYILSNRNLTQTSKLIWGIIAGFSIAGRKCFVSNAALGEALGIDERSARRAVSELLASGALEARSYGGKRYLQPILKGVEYRDEAAVSDKNVQGGGQKCPGGEDKNVPLSTNLSTPTSNEVGGSSNYAKSLEQQKPAEIMDIFDAASQDFSSGRFALLQFPFIFIHEHELRDAREKYRRAGLDITDWRDALKRCNVECEPKKRQLAFRGGMAYKYLTTHILTEALEQKKKLNQSRGYYTAEQLKPAARRRA